MTKADQKIFGAIILAMVFAALYPIFHLMMLLIHPLTVHVVWVSYLLLGVAFLFYGAIGKRRKYDFLILGAGLMAIGLTIAMGLVVNYFYAYILAAAV